MTLKAFGTATGIKARRWREVFDEIDEIQEVAAEEAAQVKAEAAEQAQPEAPDDVPEPPTAYRVPGIQVFACRPAVLQAAGAVLDRRGFGLCPASRAAFVGAGFRG